MAISNAKKILLVIFLGQVGGEAWSGDDAPTMPSVSGSPAAAATQAEFHSLDEDVQRLKNEVIQLNRDLILLEEEFLYPANSQVAFFVSLDVGDYFDLESIRLTVDGLEVANYIYSPREVASLSRGAVHRIHMANLKAGEHELIAELTGEGSLVKRYQRGSTILIEKGSAAKYVELEITDRVTRQQPEFVVREWE